MIPLTAEQLANYLIKWAEEAFPKADANEIIAVAAAMLLLKRAADQPGRYWIPDHEPLRAIARSRDPAQVLNIFLEEAAYENSRILGAGLGDFKLGRNLKPAQISQFADSLAGVSLSDSNLDFPDTVGAAYDRFLVRMVGMTGKLGGVISTPESVTELMVRITSPRTGESISDPFTGLGGFLTSTRDHVRDTDGDVAEVKLFGQESSASTWITAKLNLLLHGIWDCELAQGDTLTDPVHISADGRLMLFDRVLTHAPFSMNYDKRYIRFRERMRYGWASERGRADLMVVQHVLATLAPGGLGVVLVPLGVLFRSGPEAEIRRGMIEDGRIDAVIGLGPDILPDTSIPACVLVLRGPSRSRSERSDDVLFINAEPELTRSRGINRLGPEGIEKVVDVLRDRADLPGFSRVVSTPEVAANEFNLSVRPYTDQGLPPEAPADAVATISGDAPIREVQAAEQRFRAFGIDPTTLFVPANSGYLSFRPEGYLATARTLGKRTASREEEFGAACRSWWDRIRSEFIQLANQRRLLSSRSWLCESFRSELLPMNLLDKYQLSGIFAAWWSVWHDDLRVLEHYGARAVLDRWIARGTPYPQTIWQDPEDEVLGTLGTNLAENADTQVVMERQKLIDTYLSWGARYGTSLLQLEEEAEEARNRLEDRLRKLGYVDLG
jgi:type I restriction enzyme M protein